MGADLYISSIYNSLQEVYQEKFNQAVQARDQAKTREERDELQKDVERYYDLMYSEGYFRDSYNDSSLLWQLGLSWWKDVDRKLVNRKGYMAVPRMKRFRKMIEELSIDPEKAVAAFDEATPEEALQYFVNKKERLIAFLTQAIDLKEPIYCSL